MTGDKFGNKLTINDGRADIIFSHIQHQSENTEKEQLPNTINVNLSHLQHWLHKRLFFSRYLPNSKNVSLYESDPSDSFPTIISDRGGRLFPKLSRKSVSPPRKDPFSIFSTPICHELEKRAFLKASRT